MDTPSTSRTADNEKSSTPVSPSKLTESAITPSSVHYFASQFKTPSKWTEYDDVPVVGNPFDEFLSYRLQNPIWDPHTFDIPTTPGSAEKTPKTFRWSVDQLAIVQPADINEKPFKQSHLCRGYDHEREEENQRLIDRFFEEHASIHTPLSVTENKNRLTALSKDGLFKIPITPTGHNMHQTPKRYSKSISEFSDDNDEADVGLRRKLFNRASTSADVDAPAFSTPSSRPRPPRQQTTPPLLAVDPATPQLLEPLSVRKLFKQEMSSSPIIRSRANMKINEIEYEDEIYNAMFANDQLSPCRASNLPDFGTSPDLSHPRRGGFSDNDEAGGVGGGFRTPFNDARQTRFSLGSGDFALRDAEFGEGLTPMSPVLATGGGSRRGSGARGGGGASGGGLTSLALSPIYGLEMSSPQLSPIAKPTSSCENVHEKDSENERHHVDEIRRSLFGGKAPGNDLDEDVGVDCEREKISSADISDEHTSVAMTTVLATVDHDTGFESGGCGLGTSLFADVYDCTTTTTTHHSPGAGTSFSGGGGGGGDASFGGDDGPHYTRRSSPTTPMSALDDSAHNCLAATSTTTPKSSYASTNLTSRFEQLTDQDGRCSSCPVSQNASSGAPWSPLSTSSPCSTADKHRDSLDAATSTTSTCVDASATSNSCKRIKRERGYDFYKENDVKAENIDPRNTTNSPSENIFSSSLLANELIRRAKLEMQ